MVVKKCVVNSQMSGWDILFFDMLGFFLTSLSFVQNVHTAALGGVPLIF